MVPFASLTMLSVAMAFPTIPAVPATAEVAMAARGSPIPGRRTEAPIPKMAGDHP